MRSTVNSSDTRHNSAKQFLTLFIMSFVTSEVLTFTAEDLEPHRLFCDRLLQYMAEGNKEQATVCINFLRKEVEVMNTNLR